MPLRIRNNAIQITIQFEELKIICEIQGGNLLIRENIFNYKTYNFGNKMLQHISFNLNYVWGFTSPYSYFMYHHTINTYMRYIRCSVALTYHHLVFSKHMYVRCGEMIPYKKIIYIILLYYLLYANKQWILHFPPCRTKQQCINISVQRLSVRD